jgi:Flp pilus assembly protein TadD
MPRDPSPSTLLGIACERSGDPEAAVAAFRESVARNGDDADAHETLAFALARRQKYAEAADGFRAALARASERVASHIGLSTALAVLQDYAAAERAAQAALDRAPGAAEAQKALARALLGQGRLAEAAAAMRRAVDAAPGAPPLHVDLGNVLEEHGDAAAAEAAYRRAIALAPDDPMGHVNLGMLLLLDGRGAEGWREYDWHWRRAGVALRPFPQRRWAGEDLAGRTILAWADEGAGDEILFASQFAALARRAARVVVECDARLAALFARAFPGIEIVARANPPDARLLQADIDVQAPFSDLPRHLGVDLAAAPPPAAPYLRALPDVAAACRARYRLLGGPPIVGIAWASGNLQRPERNAPLALWDPILSLPGVTFVSLQYGASAREIAAVRDRLGVEIHTDPEIDQFASLEAFAAQIDAMDLVVSITNTTVHMAGALGRPVWTMLPAVADWRYQRSRPDTPWYPAMRLFRQTRARHWQDVIERVAGELAGFRDAFSSARTHPSTRSG